MVKRRLSKWIIWYMISAMLFIGITPGAYGGFSPSELITLSQIDRNSDLLKVQKVLESKMLRERLSQLGLTFSYPQDLGNSTEKPRNSLRAR